MAASQTITVKGNTYDVNKDLTWRELITVEELAGIPLAAGDAFDHLVVVGALMFVILKREDKSLEWDGFLDSELNDLEDADDAEQDTPAKKPAARRRPTKAAKSS